MQTAEDYIYTRQGQQRSVMLHLHTWLTEELGLTDKVRYNIPFYYGRSWICYLNPVAPDRVELAFLRGNELSNSGGLLEHRGRKQVAGILLNTVDRIPHAALDEVLQEAILLDETFPYSAKRDSIRP